MALEPGTRFGSCEVVEPIGAGGMGEVYRASDTTLKRDVALKVLPAAFAEDADRLARFRREAEILASLNHPNIAQVYGLEHSDGQTAIVMELVEGPTLAEEISSGPMPPEKAMGIAVQVVAALEAAHDRQIVHRDLKPDNIKLRQDGTVKVLDFGISKPIDPAAISGGSPLLDTPAVTQTGVILGTAAYMSPEQARGKHIDERTDIWAFGCLLFEMLTGQPAFGGEDVMLTLARVLDRDTDLSSIPNTISPAVRHTIKLCLEKDPRKRIADIRDVRLALEGTFESELPRVAGEAERAAPGARLASLAGALIAGAAMMAVVTAAIGPAPEPKRITRFTIPIPDDQQLNSTTNRVLDLSPDGRRLLYHTSDGIYVRELDSLEAVRVPGTTGEISGPTFTPDGTDISYARVLANGAEVGERISIYGGPATVFVDMSASGPLSDIASIPVMTITQTAKGTFLLSHRGGISEFDATGNGALTKLIELGDDSWPSGAQLLPDGDTVVFAVVESAEPPRRETLLNSSLVAASASASQGGAVEPSPILPRGTSPRYLASTGHLLFLRDGIVNAVAFDPDTLSARSEVRAVLTGVRPSGLGADYYVADNGTLAYLPGPSDSTAQSGPRLGWLYADGRFDTLAFAPPFGQPGTLQFPVLSPDNTRLAVAARTPDGFLDIHVYDLLRPGTRILIAGTAAAEPKAVWMPDGESLIFFRVGEGLFRRAADASNRETLVLPLPEQFQQTIPDWIHPDGTELVFTGIAAEGLGLYRLALTEGALPEPLLDEPGFDETTSSLSPDGRYIAYSTNESGSDEVHIRPYPDVTSRRIVVSTNGGSDPKWDADGGYLYYIEGAETGRITPGSLMRVAVSTDGELELGATEAVVRDSIFVLAVRPNYAHDADADRWLVYSQQLLRDNTASDQAIIVVENWTEWLENEVPTQ